ncbi:MAG: DUF975 family protein [Clostridiales bacterium]|nr:DUF975 family protein [Clostridiales bacterium]
MLDIKKCLKGAWKSMKSRYFVNVLIVFLAGIIVGGYSLNTHVATIGNSESPDILAQKEATQILDRMTGKSNSDVIKDFAESQEIIRVTTDKDSVARKYTEGVMSVLVNSISSSGSFGFGVLNGINTLVFKDKIASSIVIFAFAIILLLMNVFIKNVMMVGKCRYFLEHRRYKDTGPDKFLFVYKYGKTLNVAKVMFIKYVFQFLWNITIIGGIVKSYEYSMIPYVLAENPDIKWKEAFKISKQMTKGDKKRLFAIDIIYGIGYLISPFTFNLLAVFLLDPLKECAYSEIYMDLRDKKRDIIDYRELLNDNALEENKTVYGSYPDYAYQLKPLEKRKWIKIDYDRKYSFWTIVLFFFTFSHCGWLWEVFYSLLNNGRLVNRGTMFGPWLPIYGFGGLIIIVCLKPLRKRPFIMFIGTFIACGILEYFAAWMLETLFHTKWWDYTGFFLNIHGRVCLEGLFVFGLAGVAFTYVFAPLLDNLYSYIKLKPKKIACAVLLVLFLTDLGYSAFHPNSGAGITYDDEEKIEETAVTQ